MKKKISMAILIGSIIILMSASTMGVLSSGVSLPGNKEVEINMSNENSTRYSNGTFGFLYGGGSGGQNALQIRDDNNTNLSGNIVNSEFQEGTFFIGNSGGKTWSDTVILMLAINGTIPEDFKIIITSFGYVWDAINEGETPGSGNITHKLGINQTFYLSDFIYSSTWKPAYGSENPIFNGQNTSDLSNMFAVSFVDLDVGIIGSRILNKYPEGLINNGMIQINYIIENLPKGSSVIMNVYSFTKNVKEGNFTEPTPGIYWTNNVSKTVFSVSGTKVINSGNKNNTTTTKPPIINNNTTTPPPKTNNSVNGIWTINSKMTNSEIKNILNKAKNGNTILFTSGSYKKLQLTINKSLKIKTKGKVKITGTGKETLFKVNQSK